MVHMQCVCMNDPMPITFFYLQEAELAIHALDGKLALSKKLAVKWAHSQTPSLKVNMVYSTLIFCITLICEISIQILSASEYNTVVDKVTF